MADKVVEVRGMKELLERMKHFPVKLKEQERIGMQASMLVLWENVPAYPPPPPESKYRRTGTLGRTLGSSATGGKSGSKPEVYTVKGLGTNNVEGRFGTHLSYAEYVIGDNQAKQNRHWWKLESIIPKSQEKITKIWKGIMQNMANFLDGKGGK